MNPEIEKLIELALADGQITEKERNVVLKKAAELGVDVDEVEMVLDGKIHLLQSNKPKQKEKVGNIKACPACGASVKALEFSCSDCGHEFINKSSNSNFIELEKKLFTAKNDESRIKIINDHPISNDKETLFELLSYMSSKVLSADSQMDNELINAYQSRAIEIITKLKLICSSDQTLMQELNNISKKMNNRKSRNAFFLVSIISLSMFLGYLVWAAIARIFGAHWWPF
jgi:hypothetical protein